MAILIGWISALGSLGPLSSSFRHSSQSIDQKIDSTSFRGNFAHSSAREDLYELQVVAGKVDTRSLDAWEVSLVNHAVSY